MLMRIIGTKLAIIFRERKFFNGKTVGKWTKKRKKWKIHSICPTIADIFLPLF